MKKAIAISIVMISLVIFLLFSSVLLMDHNNVYQQLLQDTNISFTPNQISEVKVKKFPYPGIVIEHLEEEGKIELRDIEIRFSWLSLLQFSPKISKLKIGYARLYSADHSDFGFANHDKLISILIGQKTIPVATEIKTLILMDNTNLPMMNIKNLHLEGASGNNINMQFSGSINDFTHVSGYISQHKDGALAKIQVNDIAFAAQIEELYQGGKLASGHFGVQISNLPLLLSEGLSLSQAWLSGMQSAEEINIVFDIVSAASGLQVHNFKINSSAVQASGEAVIDRENTSGNSELQLQFSKIDLDHLFKPATSIANNPNANAAAQMNNMRFDFAGKTAKVNLSIDKVIANGQEIKNIKVISSLKDGKLVFEDFSGLIGQDGAFAVGGTVTQNSFRSLFDGSIKVQHNNLAEFLKVAGSAEDNAAQTPFAFAADLNCTLVDVYFQNLIFKTATETITGAASSKFIGSTPRISANLKISSLDIARKDYPVISSAISFMRSITENMKDSNYLSKFIPLRTISYYGDFDITVNKLFNNSESLGRSNILLNIEPGDIEVTNFYINNGPHYLSSSFRLNAIGLKPHLVVNIEDGMIDVDFLTPRHLLELRNKLMNDFDIDQMALALNCHFLNMKQNGLLLEKMKFTLESDNTLLKLSNFESDVLGGHMTASGSILLDPFTYNFVYGFNSINLEQLSALLPSGLMNGSGIASISGMMTTNGDSLEKQLYNLYVKASVLAKDTIFNNFAIDDMISKINTAGYDDHSFDNDLKNTLLTGKTKVNNLQANIELSKGIASLTDIGFKTISTAGVASANINVYDFGINLSSVFSFYLLDEQTGKGYASQKPIKLGLNITGTLFSPIKKADDKEIKQAVQGRYAGKPKKLY